MKKILDHLNENWIKYGFETFVIIIGILGAFTLNNWNEARKDWKKETALLIELRENLIEDVSMGRKQIENQTIIIDNLEKLVLHFESNQAYNDTLNPYVGSAGWLESFEVNVSAYESLKNTGLEKLSSATLKKEISKYYDVRVPHRSDIVDRLNVMQQESITVQRIKAWETYEGDYQNLLVHMAGQSRLIINYLKSRISWKRNFVKDICQPNINDAQALADLIEKELKRR